MYRAQRAHAGVGEVGWQTLYCSGALTKSLKQAVDARSIAQARSKGEGSGQVEHHMRGFTLRGSVFGVSRWGALMQSVLVNFPLFLPDQTVGSVWVLKNGDGFRMQQNATTKLT